MASRLATRAAPSPPPAPVYQRSAVTSRSRAAGRSLVDPRTSARDNPGLCDQPQVTLVLGGGDGDVGGLAGAADLRGDGVGNGGDPVEDGVRGDPGHPGLGVPVGGVGPEWRRSGSGRRRR